MHGITLTTNYVSVCEPARNPCFRELGPPVDLVTTGSITRRTP